jgi:prepilin-type N-terminal cleavage/methylation domain-containing protein
LARIQSTSRWLAIGQCGLRSRALRRAQLGRASAGFTLTELMVVVIIAGVLATVGFASLRKQVTAAWSAEGLSMVQSIRAAQERWRAEHMIYLNVSTPDQWYPYDPRDTPGQAHAFFFDPSTIAHVNQNAWLMLRPTVAGPVRFGYLVNAGNSGEAMTAPSSPGPSVTWPTPTDNWFVIQAIGDTNGDGACSYYGASSLDGEVFIQNGD